MTNNQLLKFYRGGMKNIENMNELIDVISFRERNDTVPTDVFRVSNQLMHHAIADIFEGNRDSLITVDISDLRTLIFDTGITIIASAIASGEDRAIIATKNAISSLILEGIVMTRVRRFFIRIIYIGSLNLKEVLAVIKSLRAAVDEDTLIVTSTAVNESMDDNIRVMLFAISFDTPMECNYVI
jgi:cell division protein FtsZ